VTDDAENRVDAGRQRDVGDRTGADGSAVDSPAVDGSTADAPTTDTPPGDPDMPVDFGDLSLPQRAFVAAVQNPTRGIVIVGLLAFAFSFYVAFWLVFPRVAAFMSAIGAVLLGIVALVYFVSDRFAR